MSLVAICSLAIAVSAIVAGSAEAATGGNRNTAQTCQHGGWRALVSQSGARFTNQGDCVNDGAQGLAVGPPTAEQVCLSIPGSPQFTDLGEGSWKCTFLSPPGPESTPSSFDPQCLGDLSFQVNGDVATIACDFEEDSVLGVCW
jgi:hypothetical protein